MPRPQYPTSEGLWSRGKRGEAGYGAVRLGTPYPEAVESLRKAVEGMFHAIDDSGMGRITAWVEKLIPRGAECCHFVVERTGDSPRPWRSAVSP